MKYILSLCKLVLISLFVSLVACDDGNIYETKEVYSINAQNNYVNLREQPSTKSRVIVKCDVNTVIAHAEVYDQHWYYVVLGTGHVGYVSSKYISYTTQTTYVRKKNHRDDLVERNQVLTLILYDFYDKGIKEKTVCPVWLLITTFLTLALGFVLVAICSKHLIWIAYLVNILDAALLSYVFFSYDSWKLHWILDFFVVGLFLFFVVLLWLSLFMATSELIYESRSAIWLMKGNLWLIVLSTMCAFWIESCADIVVLILGVWNVIGAILYLVEAGRKKCFLRGVLGIMLWIICFIPYVTCTVLALYFFAVLALLLLLLDVGFNAINSMLTSPASEGDTIYVETFENSSLRIKLDPYSSITGTDDNGCRWKRYDDGCWYPE